MNNLSRGCVSKYSYHAEKRHIKYLVVVVSMLCFCFLVLGLIFFSSSSSVFFYFVCSSVDNCTFTLREDRSLRSLHSMK